MLVNPSRILKTVYKGLLLGVPQILYSPLFNSNLLVPLEVEESSTYINYNLCANEVCTLTNYIHKYNNSLELVPISILENEKEDYYLSVNIYNCSSPILLTDKSVTRCELNVYVKDYYNNYGTLIIDYITNGQSMDPISLLKLPELEKICKFIKNKDDYRIINVSPIHKLNITANFSTLNIKSCKLNSQLIDYTGNIFYKDGILDKLYYDNSLTNAETYKVENFDVDFNYRNIKKKKPSSIFFFKNKINFVGSMWHNVYRIRRHRPTLRERFALSYISRKK